MDVIARQAKSQAAEQAVKLTIFQPTEEGEAPQQAQAAPAPVQPTEAQKSDVDSTEPVLRETTQAPPKPVSSVNDIVKKWSTKT
jgi:hypothetical protein